MNNLVQCYMSRGWLFIGGTIEADIRLKGLFGQLGIWIKYTILRSLCWIESIAKFLCDMWSMLPFSWAQIKIRYNLD